MINYIEPINIIDNLDVNPNSMEFSNEMTTLKILASLESKCNKVITALNEWNKTAGEYTDQQFKILSQTLESISKRVANGEYIPNGSVGLEKLNGDLRQYIQNTLNESIDNSIGFTEFGLDDEGRLIAYICDNWHNVAFRTDENGHLITVITDIDNNEQKYEIMLNETTFQEMTNQCFINKDDIQDLQTRIATAEKNIDIVMKNGSLELEQLKNNVSELTQQFETATKTIQDNKEMSYNNGEQIKIINATLTNMNNVISSNVDRIATIEKNLTNVQNAFENISQNTSDISEMREVVKVHSDALLNITPKVEQAVKDITTLQENINTIEQNVNNNTASIKGLNSSLESVRNTVNQTMQQSIGQLQQDVATNQNNITVLQNSKAKLVFNGSFGSFNAVTGDIVVNGNSFLCKTEGIYIFNVMFVQASADGIYFMQGNDASSGILYSLLDVNSNANYSKMLRLIQRMSSYTMKVPKNYSFDVGSYVLNSAGNQGGLPSITSMTSEKNIYMSIYKL